MGSNDTDGRLVRTAGVAAGVIWALTSVVADGMLGLSDPTGDPVRVQQIVLDHPLAAWTMLLGSVYLAVAVVFFAAATQRRLSTSGYGTAALGGGVLLAVAMVVHQGIGPFALLSAANHHDTASVHTLGYLDAVTWLLLSAGSGAFLLATGIGARRANAMPRWLSVATVALGVLALLGPGALVFYYLAPVWFVVAALALDRRHEVAGDEVTRAATPPQSVVG